MSSTERSGTPAGGGTPASTGSTSGTRSRSRIERSCQRRDGGLKFGAMPGRRGAYRR
jgi:hypothetical protein